MYTTYSFLDLSGSIAHPVKGTFVFTGEGIGELIVSMSTEKTAHDVAADGAVMVSKIPGNNGTLSIQCQQTSDLHKWLLEWYNYLMQADVSEWALTTSHLRNINDGTSHNIIGITPQKVPDKTYQAQGQKVTWVLMAADISNMLG